MCCISIRWKKIDYLPAAVDDQLKVTPIYKIFKGWKSSTKGIKNFNDLPTNAKICILNLENLLKLKYQVYQQAQKETTQF